MNIQCFNWGYFIKAKPARLGSTGKFCSMVGEEADGDGKKTRAKVKIKIWRREVILATRFA